jgi:hypothetical protein
VSELFNGRWVLDLPNSKVWDVAQSCYVADEAGQEIVNLCVRDGVQDYEVLYGDDPVIRLGYTCRYDDAEWVPYVVREILVTAGRDPQTAVAEFRRRTKSDTGLHARRFEVGKPYGFLRVVLVDAHTHYRVNRSEGGEAQYVMMRRLDADGRAYTAVVLGSDGLVFRVRRFVRA